MLLVILKFLLNGMFTILIVLKLLGKNSLLDSVEIFRLYSLYLGVLKYILATVMSVSDLMKKL